MPALWGHCSNKATEPARICADCVKGNGLFGSYKQVVGENGALWGGACTSLFAPSGTKRCSLSANYDPQYRKKRKAAEPGKPSSTKVFTHSALINDQTKMQFSRITTARDKECWRFRRRRRA